MLELMERFHTILADLFPHHGLKAVGGSRILIGTALFPVAKDCVEKIRNEVESSPDANTRMSLTPLFTEAAELIGRIEREGRTGNEEKINEAATLLYLVSGVAWNYVAHELGTSPSRDPNHVRVEPLGPLFNRCGRRMNVLDSVELQPLLGQLTAEMKTCLRKLRL